MSGKGEKRSLKEKLLTFLGFGSKGFDYSVKSYSVTDTVYDKVLVTSELANWLNSLKQSSVLSQMFSTLIRKKVDLIDLVDAYKDTFYHQMIVEMLCDDVLNVDPLTNNIVDISCSVDNEDVRRVLDDLQERIDIDGFINAVTEDVVSYGDYVVRVEHDGKKVTSIEDDVDQRKVLPVYKGGRQLFLVELEEGKTGMLENTQFLHFCVGGRKLRFKVNKETLLSVGKDLNISEYVRMGKPLFWGKWDLLNSLYVLTVFYPVFAVNKLNASTIIGVKVPADTPPKLAVEIARKYQELFNVSVGVDAMGRVSIADVIDTIGKYKVVPMWGDEKGTTSIADPRVEESFGLDVLEELKKVLSASVGVPYSFLFGGEGTESRLGVLRNYSRYVKKVASIQRAIREALIELAIIECRLRGLYVTSDMIEVRFRNSLVSVENLDKLEFMASMIDTVNNAVDVVSGIAEKLGVKKNKDVLIDFVNRYFGMAGLDNVLSVGVESDVEGVEDVGGFDDLLADEGFGSEEEEFVVATEGEEEEG